ncbi:MAG: NUDIX domain-containing protein [Vicinamibacterales bacterium]
MSAVGADVPIKPASTIVVMRDGAEGPELFLVRRHYSIAFMAGAHVFPGGRVDPADGDADASWCDLPEAGPGWPSTAFAVAAIRELFEEAGILLARAPEGPMVTIEGTDRRPWVERSRTAVHDGTLGLRHLLARESLRLAVDTVVPFAHWVTPPIEVRRFDTWFFLCMLPAGQEARHDTHESIDSGWFTPRAALDACRQGRINLPPPTWATLRELEPFATAAEAIAWARTRTIVARQPRVIDAGGVREIVLPGHATHPSGEQSIFETRFTWVDGRWLPHVP